MGDQNPTVILGEKSYATTWRMPLTACRTRVQMRFYGTAVN